MRKYAGLALCLVAASLIAAPTIQAQTEQKLLSAELIWEIERIGSPVISPNGQQIVVPITHYDLDTDRGQSQLWLYHPEQGEQRALTAAGLRASNATFVPNGNTLAFISQRDKDDAGQVYLLPMDGPGEATRLTSVPTGVSNIQWAGDYIYFMSSVWPDKTWEQMSEQLTAQKNRKVSAHKWTDLPYASFDRWLDEERATHVFRIPAAGGEVEAVTATLLANPMKGVGGFHVHPDGNWIAFTTDTADGVVPKIDLFLAEVGSDQARNLTIDNAAPDANPMFSPDGKTLAFTRQRIVGFYADQTNLILHDLETGNEREITADFDRSVGGLVWTPDSQGFFGSIDDAGTVRVYHIDADTGATRAITGATNFSGLSIADNGTLVGTNESFLYPAQLVRINAESGEVTRLDTRNDELLADVDLGHYESVTYEGYNGQEIQMWVHYPPGFDASKQYPLFLLIHGGPHSAITDGFHYRWNAQTFASWGYVTAWHNFHGSSGFGQDFTDYINPDWLTAPYADTIAAAEWFMEKDWIDNDRMVAGGASYGGYLSSILLSHDHPFNALLIHAPVYNMYSQMSADFAVHADRFGGFWENPEIYKKISPHYYADNFNTPALVSHGQLDYRVPVGQGFEIFRTLRSRGIESRMIYFPDENHWILKPNNSIYWYNEVKDWMGKFAQPGAR